MTEVACVIPVGAGREDNLTAVLTCVRGQTVVPRIVVVEDGPALQGGITGLGGVNALHVKATKHAPGLEQPRNIGVRMARETWPEVTHAWFLDSDVVVDPDCLELLLEALDDGPEDRILVAPYDWMGPGERMEQLPSWVPGYFYDCFNDPRWAMFRDSPTEKVYRNDLSAGLACFSGNLMWPIDEFIRVGGFWSELHHGRCEDGELGLRAVAMDVGISLQARSRGWHMYHEVDVARTIAANTRDVPMLNARHPWVEGADVFMVDRDGKAFDVRCSKCQAVVPTVGWWAHARDCGVEMALTP